MRAISIMRIGLVAAFLSPGAALALTPQDIQQQIAGGQAQAALGELQSVLAAHPDSGVAWYLSAEAQDVAGNEAAARDDLAKAQQYAPGLPFASPAKAAALSAHLNGAPAAARRGISPVVFGIGLLVVLFLVFRMFTRSRRRFAAPGAYPNGYGPGMQGGAPGGPFGMGGGMGGGGMGSSLLGGLAAGAGFAAGERAIDGMFGGGNGGGLGQGFGNNDPTPTDRDDGLNGSPGWDDNSGGGGDIDQNSGW